MHKISILWRTYIFLVSFSVVCVGAISYFIWLNILSETKMELVSANKTLSSSVQSILRKNESFLQILGERLVDAGDFENPSRATRALISGLLKNNPELAGFGLAKPSGQLVLTSFKTDRNNLPNLLTIAESSASFKKALESDRMVVGRTYYLKTLGQWVIPLRYRILDANGKVSAVMTTGLKLNSAGNLWASSVLPDHMKTFIVRKDFYRQYVPEGTFGSLDEAYSSPIPDETIQAFEQSLMAEKGWGLSAIREDSSHVFTASVSYTIQNILGIASFAYEPRYEYYTVIITPKELVLQKLYQPIYWLIGVFIIFNITLFWIFRSNTRLQEEAKRSLKFQATHDALTSLPNRRFLMEAFSQWKLDCQGQFYVIFIDLDNFKNCNDLHGHAVGDQILQEVASRIKECFPTCLKVRPGGDEFIILCEDKGTAHTLSLCNNFLQQLTEPIDVSGVSFSIKASIGVAHAPVHGSNINDLLRKADMAMYEAKVDGNTSFMFFDYLEQKRQETIVIENELNSALEKNEFFLVYQPQIDALTKSIIGVEVLIRWDNKKLGRVPPDVFIPIVESAGLIIDIGGFVLEKSMQEFSEICASSDQYKALRLSINISIYQLLEPAFVKQLSALSERFPRLPLAIEVTESLFIEDLNSAKLVLEAVQAIGIDISLDDFGTGYSSLSVLNSLPINELKVDRSFVKHALTSDSDKSLIQSIISLGKGLGIPVLSEGVESKEQADLLLEFGCDLFQGYYFSKPLKKDELETYLSQYKHE